MIVLQILQLALMVLVFVEVRKMKEEVIRMATDQELLDTDLAAESQVIQDLVATVDKNSTDVAAILKKLQDLGTGLPPTLQTEITAVLSQTSSLQDALAKLKASNTAAEGA